MPRLGLGMPITSDTSSAPVVAIDDFLWENYSGSSGEIAINYQETRTNIILHSQDATDAEAWTKGNTAIDSTLYEAPDNSTTANAIKSDNTGSRNYKITQSSLTLTTGKTYTVSVHVKKQNLGFARIKSHDGSTPFRADFNLTTGAVTNTTNTIRTQVDAMDDDWYRCSITFQATATTSSAYVEVFACAASGDSQPNVAVSGVVLLYVWGFQLEESIEATAYIPTVDAARTKTTTLNDFSKVWDFDSANLMPEVDPDSEGVWEVPANVVLNGNYEELGSELVTNGTFDADSNWIKDANWSIANGKATSTSNGRMYQSIPELEGNEGTVVQVTFDIVERTSGGVVVNCYGGVSSLFNTVGTHSFVTTTTNSLNLYFNNSGAGNLVGSIDNVSVKQVDPNSRWTLGTGWSVEDGKAVHEGGSSNTYLEQQNITTIGSVYEAVFTLSGSLNATNYIQVYGASSYTISPNKYTSAGTYTLYFTADATYFRFRAVSPDNDISIDNVTVTEYAITPLNV